MRVIGLTGSIACGKSLVSSALKSEPDCRVIDGDALSRELTAPGGPALTPLRRRFGNGIFLPDGQLDRKALGQWVFSDPSARAALDDLMAPLLEKLTHDRLEDARISGATLCFLDYPLLFEKGYDRLCDRVWCVYLPESLQLRRLRIRDGLTEAEAMARIRAVLSSEEKAARSGVVIDNSGSREHTLSLLPSLLSEERSLAGRPVSPSPRRRRSAPDVPASVPAAPAPVTDRPFVPVPASFTPDNGREAPVSPHSPAVMDRPEGTGRERKKRTAGWQMPVWLRSLLIGVAVAILLIVTSWSLMSAYMKRRSDEHAAEQQAILNYYHLSWRDLIGKYADEYNLDPAFVAAIIRNESSFDPHAESNVGARGLMQLMPETAEWIAGKLKVPAYTFDRMWDPETNIRFGCWYLNYLANLFRGDPVSVACAYHAGQGTVTAWLSDPAHSGDGITLTLDRLKEGPTKTYAGRVVKAYGIYRILYFENREAAPAGVSGAVPGLLASR